MYKQRLHENVHGTFNTKLTCTQALNCVIPAAWSTRYMHMKRGCVVPLPVCSIAGQVSLSPMIVRRLGLKQQMTKPTALLHFPVRMQNAQSTARTAKVNFHDSECWHEPACKFGYSWCVFSLLYLLALTHTRAALAQDVMNVCRMHQWCHTGGAPQARV
eukprot:1890361-Amphidinium_carterae.1